MKDLKVYVSEFMEYKLSEGRDAEKTIEDFSKAIDYFTRMG